MRKSLCPFCQTLCGVTVHGFNHSALCEAHKHRTAEEMAEMEDIAALYEETRDRYRTVYRRRTTARKAAAE